MLRKRDTTAGMQPLKHVRMQGTHTSFDNCRSEPKSAVSTSVSNLPHSVPQLSFSHLRCTHHFCKSSYQCDFAKIQPMTRRFSSLKVIDDKGFRYWSKIFSKVLCHFEKYVTEWMRPSLNKDSKFKVLHFIQNCLSAHGSCDFKWGLLASLVMFACCHKPPICNQ